MSRKYISTGRLAKEPYAVLAVILLVCVESVKVDRSVCKELQDHLQNLETIQMKTVSSYRPYQDNPPEYETKIASIDTEYEATHEKLNAIDQLILDLKSYSKTGSPKSSGFRFSCLIYGLCSGNKQKERDQIEDQAEQVASTYAQFYRAQKLWENGNRFYALFQIRKLKLERQSISGVPMDRVFDLEQELLRGAVDRCLNNPRSMFGDEGRDFDYWVASKLLLNLFDPNQSDAAETQQQTWDIVYRLILYAKTKVQKFGYDLDHKGNSDEDEKEGQHSGAA